MILSAQSIRRRSKMVQPFTERTVAFGMTYGLGPAGYDVRIAETLTLSPGGWTLASTVERFEMPNDLLARVTDKSTWAREGLAVQNTIIEPGWCGYLTLELSNHGRHAIYLDGGMPIAQIIFDRLDEPTDTPYAGKYQDQPAGVVRARFALEPL